MATDHYETLQLSAKCSFDEVKRQYRALAREYHPDKWVKGSPSEVDAATKKFKIIQNAYDTLNDPDARRRYDQVRTQRLREEERAAAKAEEELRQRRADDAAAAQLQALREAARLRQDAVIQEAKIRSRRKAEDAARDQAEREKKRQELDRRHLDVARMVAEAQARAQSEAKATKEAEDAQARRAAAHAALHSAKERAKATKADESTAATFDFSTGPSAFADRHFPERGTLPGLMHRVRGQVYHAIVLFQGHDHAYVGIQRHNDPELFEWMENNEDAEKPWIRKYWKATGSSERWASFYLPGDSDVRLGGSMDVRLVFRGNKFEARNAAAAAAGSGRLRPPTRPQRRFTGYGGYPSPPRSEPEEYYGEPEFGYWNDSD